MYSYTDPPHYSHSYKYNMWCGHLATGPTGLICSTAPIFALHNHSGCRPALQKARTSQDAKKIWSVEELNPRLPRYRTCTRTPTPTTAYSHTPYKYTMWCGRHTTRPTGPLCSTAPTIAHYILFRPPPAIKGKTATISGRRT